MLERFYTDLAGNHSFGQTLSLGRAVPRLRPALERLAKRTLPPEILSSTTTFPGPLLRHTLRQRLGKQSAEASFVNQVTYMADRSKAMIRRGFGNATHIYSMLNEGGHFLAEAKRRGLTVVSEVYILLSTERIMAVEQKKFPEWEPDAPDYSRLRERYLASDTYPRDIDLCICPSEAVLEDLVANWGIARERTALVPYGMDPRWLALEPAPEPGRVLFVGTADLRKGIHYLAMASEILRSRGFKGEFRIAGNVTDTIRHHPTCRHLTFLGRVPRDLIHEEFRRADLFVLPSLAEGSAEVTYEALAAGVPQIVTRAAGSVARDGIEGLVVPERDPEALAGAIEQGVTDHDWRDAAALASRERARNYTWEKYTKRLLSCLLDK
jgi:glycosyltransferase involved in cell wall biosynthesis